MSVDRLEKAADRARNLLRNRSDVGSVGVSRNPDGNLCVRVDVDPGTDKDAIRNLLQPIEAPVVVRSVGGVLRAH
ncbi:hypothetical protein RA307_01575 [Xanthobacteraceae bacterium Astr-EGSB]|uniref:hypothetical protein n=1 Tax=Astrobacterium formosum TaxID=3069710 RepID=UPI0027B660F5|nr:hypothetical protein [Xanthobacteraceae bacterium Astr-EGSB]